MAEEERTRMRVINEALPFVLMRLTDGEDLSSASLVCKDWYQRDRTTRERVTIPLSYGASPARLSERFPNLKCLHLKGRPITEMFELVEPFWGSDGNPWINEIAISKFSVVKSIGLKRIIISDLDLDVLSRALANKLEALELKCCRGFTTDGLLSITKGCRKIESLVIADSCLLEDKGGQWLHEVALHNGSLRVLHFHETNFSKVTLEDLQLIAKKCHKSLVSLKVSGFDLLDLERTLRSAKELEEFYGGCVKVDPHNALDDDKYINVHEAFPPNLDSIGDIVDLHFDEVSILYGIANKIKTLDLYRTNLRTDGHCLLLERLPNLEKLRTSNIISNEGLLVLSEFCQKLRELEIRLAPDYTLSREVPVMEGIITDTGLIALANNCIELVSLTVCMIDISNFSFQAIAENLKELRNFSLYMIPTFRPSEEDMQLDLGIRLLLGGCVKLEKLYLDLLPGYLITDVGLHFIAMCGCKLRSIRLVFASDVSDFGLHALANGCKRLRKLELRDCSFTENGIITAGMNSSLRYLYASGYKDAVRGDHLVAYSSVGQGKELKLLKVGQVCTATELPTAVIDVLNHEPERILQKKM